MTIPSRRPGHKIRITADDITPQSVRVFVDEVEMSHFSQLKLEMGVGRNNTATIAFYASDIEIDAQAVAILKAQHLTEPARAQPAQNLSQLREPGVLPAPAIRETIQ